MPFNTRADIVTFTHPHHPGTGVTLTHIEMFNLGGSHVDALRAGLYRLARAERESFNNGATSGTGSAAEDLYFHLFKEHVFDE